MASLGAGLAEDGEAEEDEEELGPGAAQQLQSLSEALMREIRELESLGLLDTSDGMVNVPVAALDAVYDAVVDYEEEAAGEEEFDDGFDDEADDQV
ncbi:hypothetical protein [Sinomonas atrocyanea]|uniref:hypothetical protein n=1 Tax=Sinomonas atrocyanea TaxID=37927 RepID=UPI0008319213|nr:hypothetical protein [Sinomonas atrocyanea]